MRSIATITVLLCCLGNVSVAQRSAYMDSLEYFTFKKDYKKAIVYLDKLIKLYPDEAWFHIRKGEFLYDLSDLNKAKTEYTKAIELDSSLWHARGQRGSIYLRLEQYDSALLDFNRIMGKSRELDSITYSFRAYTYQSLKNYKAAEKDYDAIIKLRPDDPDLYINRSVVRERLGNFEAALQDVNQVIELDKTSADPYGNRAYLYSRLGKMDEAISSIQVFLKAYPNDEMANCLAGELLSYKKDYENAIPHLTLCVQKQGRKDGYMLRAMAHYNTAHWTAAMADFQKALTFKLSTAEEAEALYHIGVCKNKQKPKSGCDYIRKAFQKGANDEKQKRVLLAECQ